MWTAGWVGGVAWHWHTLTRAPGVCRPKHSRPGSPRSRFRSCCLKTLSLSPALLRDPPPPPSPPRTWPERRGRRLSGTRFGGTGPAWVLLCLPPAAATVPRLAVLRPAPWRNPEQIRQQPATSPESLAWRLLGEMSRGGGISAGPKLPQKARAEIMSIRVGWELEVLLPQPLRLLFSRAQDLFI